MKHYSVLSACLILLIGCMLNSCSTSYEARKFSHLNYVKTGDKVKYEEPNAITKKELKQMKNSYSPSSLEAPNADYAASADKKPDTKAITQHHYNLKDNNSFSSTKPVAPVKMDRKEKKELKMEAKNYLKQDKLVMAPKHRRGGGLMDNPMTLLFLWLGAAVAVIILSIVFVATGGVLAFAILASLASIASLVFFIMWIIALTNS